MLHWHTMVEGLDWLPEDGVVLTRGDLERIFLDLRALIDGTGKLDIAVTIARALEREGGGA